MTNENALAVGYNSSSVELLTNFPEQINSSSLVELLLKPSDDLPIPSNPIKATGVVYEDGGDSVSGSIDDTFFAEELQLQKRLIKKSKPQNSRHRHKRMPLRTGSPLNVLLQQHQQKKSACRSNNLIVVQRQKPIGHGYSMPPVFKLLGVTGKQRRPIADTNSGDGGSGNATAPSNGQGRRGDNSSMAGRSNSGKRPIQAKQNEAYLVTTLFPGKSGGGGNGGVRMQPALINKVLPIELILRIFSFLDIISLCRCAQVSRFWNRLAMDGSNWQDVDLFLFQREVKTSVVENLAKRCGSFLKGLSLRGCESIQDSAMRSFALKCPNIERLMLTKCKLITDATCEYIGRYCHRLTILDLENCPAITDLTCKFISEGCKSLEEVNIGWCHQITDLGIGYISRGCPNLTTLICKGCSGLSPNGFSQMDLGQLRKLSLFSCPASFYSPSCCMRSAFTVFPVIQRPPVLVRPPLIERPPE